MQPGFWDQLQSVFLSLWNTFILYVLVWHRDRQLLGKVLGNPLNVWYELLSSALRLKSATLLLHQLRPKLIITNGEHLRIASELLLSEAADNAHKIWFFNENPLPGLVPTLSDEVWVWNKSIVDAFEEIKPPNTSIKYEIIGKPEIDFALQTPQHRMSEEDTLREQAQGRRTLLFLSGYVDSKAHQLEELTRESLRWVAGAARLCPDWCFVFKARPGMQGLQVPGIELFADLPNCIIPESDISLRRFLSWDNLLVIAANSSTGLLVAAGVGKMALRLWASSLSEPLPVTDPASIPIHSLDALAETLLNFDAAFSQYQRSLEDREEALFPYRGRSVQRMENLCLQRLGLWPETGE